LTHIVSSSTASACADPSVFNVDGTTAANSFSTLDEELVEIFFPPAATRYPAIWASVLFQRDGASRAIAAWLRRTGFDSRAAGLTIGGSGDK
jgi:hypothetical protein